MTTETQSFSYIIDGIVRVFNTVKRPQEYFRSRCRAGDFYYYGIMGALFSRHPVQVIEADLDGVDGFVMLTRQEKRAAIYGAIRKFLGDNGQGDLVERLVRQNKLDVMIR